MKLVLDIDMARQIRASLLSNGDEPVGNAQELDGISVSEELLTILISNDGQAQSFTAHPKRS